MTPRYSSKFGGMCWSWQRRFHCMPSEENGRTRVCECIFKRTQLESRVAGLMRMRVITFIFIVTLVAVSQGPTSVVVPSNPPVVGPRWEKGAVQQRTYKNP